MQTLMVAVPLKIIPMITSRAMGSKATARFAAMRAEPWGYPIRAPAPPRSQDFPDTPRFCVVSSRRLIPRVPLPQVFP